MDAAVERGLRQVFETWDGRGHPGRQSGDAVPTPVYCVALASDFEILGRARGLAPALEAIARLADTKYPARLVALLARHAADWLAELDARPDDLAATPPAGGARDVPLELVADVADLKLPWLAGHSRRVADCARATGAVLGLDAHAQSLLQRAGLIHAMGRAAVANHVWQRPGRLSASDWERVRLMPYWTSRAAALIPGLKAEAELASHAFERLDGEGYYRNAGGASLSPSHRVLGTAVALVALRSPRPWRAAHDDTAAAAALRGEAADGRFDRDVAEAALAAMAGAAPRAPARAAATLSQRETEVLRRISLGESNKEVARALTLSPSTVRTHIESVFRKLECSTRAAATLKAFTLGLL
jgi:HD-GYP domain-containing protein (c-di-GMP phosphodiesterase class II)